jgi:hypothetical protein
MNVEMAENDFMTEMVFHRIVIVDLAGRRSRKRRGPTLTRY